MDNQKRAESVPAATELPATAQAEKNPRKKHYKLIGLACFIIGGLLILGGIGIAFAETRPVYISGNLTAENGQPVSDGAYKLQMRLLDVENGNVVYENDKRVTIDGGSFNTDIKPSDQALAKPAVLIMCLYAVAPEPSTQQPARTLPGCKASAHRAIGVICAPQLVRANALGWKGLLSGDNSIKDIQPCRTGKNATVGTDLNFEYLTKTGMVDSGKAALLNNYLHGQESQQ